MGSHDGALVILASDMKRSTSFIGLQIAFLFTFICSVCHSDTAWVLPLIMKTNKWGMNLHRTTEVVIRDPEKIHALLKR